jgi:hypothetical protein
MVDQVDDRRGSPGVPKSPAHKRAIAEATRRRWEDDLAARQRLGKLRDRIAGGLDDPKVIGAELDQIVAGLRGAQ